MKSEDLTTLPEELKLKSDLEIHQFCSAYESLKHLCLTDDQVFNSSGKLLELRTKLQKMHKKENRILIFSQFTQNVLLFFILILTILYLEFLIF